MALKRAARIGDGWFGVRHTVESATAIIKQLRALRDSDAPFEIMMQPVVAPPTLDDIRRFRDAGVDRLAFNPKALAGDKKTLQASLDGLSRFAETVLSRIDE